MSKRTDAHYQFLLVSPRYNGATGRTLVAGAEGMKGALREWITSSVRGWMSNIVATPAGCQFGPGAGQPPAHRNPLPATGWVTNLLAQLGDYANVGQNEISVVDADSFWVVRIESALCTNPITFDVGGCQKLVME